MEQPYSAWADWLNKFHTASEMIQALWVVAGAATVVAVTWVVMRGVVEVVRVWRGGRTLEYELLCNEKPQTLNRLPLGRVTREFLPVVSKEKRG